MINKPTGRASSLPLIIVTNYETKETTGVYQRAADGPENGEAVGRESDGIQVGQQQAEKRRLREDHKPYEGVGMSVAVDV